MCSSLRLKPQAQTAYARDVVCSGCALNLQGLDLSRDCPRCGIPARQSLNATQQPISAVNSAMDMATGLRNLRLITGYQIVVATVLQAPLVIAFVAEEKITHALGPASAFVKPICLGLLTLFFLLSVITIPATTTLWAKTPPAYRPDYRVPVVKPALFAASAITGAAALALIAAVFMGSKQAFLALAMPCLGIAVPWGITLSTLCCAYIAQKTTQCMPDPQIQEGATKAFLLIFVAAGFQVLAVALFLLSDQGWFFCASLLVSLLSIAEVFNRSLKVESALESIQ